MAERTPTLSMLEAKSIDGDIKMFCENESITIPAKRYYALVGDDGNIAGIIYSEKDGFSHCFSESEIRMKQYCSGARPAIMA